MSPSPFHFGATLRLPVVPRPRSFGGPYVAWSRLICRTILGSLPCPLCGATLILTYSLTWNGRLVCSDLTCDHVEPLPARIEVEKAGGTRLPGLEDPHPYEPACAPTHHLDCICMHPVDGLWCGKDRGDPIHAPGAEGGA